MFSELEELKGQKILVMGAARSGISASKLLLQVGAIVTLTDIKPESDLDPSIKDLKNESNFTLHSGGHYESDFSVNKIIVISPGIPSDHKMIIQAKIYGAKIISELELAYHFYSGKLFGITGTNGKTTTATLTGEILKASDTITSMVAGNIGYPLTTAVLENPDTNIIVTEISSFQLENIEDFSVNAGVVLNIDADHMDRYKSIEEYAKVKSLIFNKQEEDDWRIINSDDNFSSMFRTSSPGNLIEFSVKQKLEKGIYLREKDIIISLPLFNLNNFKFLNTTELKLKGLHNIENIMPSIAFGLIAGVDIETIHRVITGFSGLPHRIEFIDEINGVRFYNDSKATNVSAVLRAIEMFKEEKLILILGGSDKNLDFTPLIESVKNNVKSLILIGETAPKLRAIFDGVKEFEIAGSLEETVKNAYKNASPGGIVLLSPACASFDWFNNYKDRGEQFKKEVELLKKRLEDDE
ncbi:UDP-N-acetylmuramoyl-L-alanine--D-glutamate ligase [Candidatus Dependentiae bacterium]|nr:UDP-N-acetylmuramoyl-L-alanine--D-glutamate ligase [Candidatus Dependentiae bacterium]